MAKISFDWIPAESNLYVRIIGTTDDYIWNGSALEVYVAGNIGNYAVALTEHSPGHYSVDIPTIGTGQFAVPVFQNATPAVTDEPLGTGILQTRDSTEITSDDLVTIKDILEGDEAIDTGAAPYQRVVTHKTTEAELIRKDLKDIDGNDITNINTVIGSMEEPA